MAANENNNTYSGNRYPYDLQQAEAMRRSQRGLGTTTSTKQGNIQQAGHSSSERTVESVKKRLTFDDIQLALRGLEEAESQRVKGNIQYALRLYELSLEILILFLKDAEHSKRTTGVDPSTVAARVNVALSDAERLKEQSPKITAAATETNTSPSSFVTGMIASLSNALLGPSKKGAVSTSTRASSTNAGAGGNAAAPLSGTIAPNTTKKPEVGSQIRTPATKIKKKGTPSVSSKTNLTTGDTRAHNSPQSVKSTASATTKTTSLRLGDPAKDQLYKAVLDDLYVEPEKIQKTSWDDIAGLQDVKQSLQESAILPLVRPDLFTGLRKPQNILLWG